MKCIEIIKMILIQQLNYKQCIVTNLQKYSGEINKNSLE